MWIIDFSCHYSSGGTSDETYKSEIPFNNMLCCCVENCECGVESFVFSSLWGVVLKRISKMGVRAKGKVKHTRGKGRVKKTGSLCILREAIASRRGSWDQF